MTQLTTKQMLQAIRDVSDEVSVKKTETGYYARSGLVSRNGKNVSGKGVTVKEAVQAMFNGLVGRPVQIGGELQAMNKKGDWSRVKKSFKANKR